MRRDRRSSDESSVYILLTDTGTLFTRLIRCFTGAAYNHASLALDEELNELYSFGRKRPNAPWLAGFVREDVYEGTFRHFSDTQCVLLRLGVSAEQRNNVMAVIDEFQRKADDCRYNLLGLLAVPLGLEWKRDNAYFCSQFAAEALRLSGIRLWDRPSSLIAPNDFLEHPGFEVVYEGALYHYPLLDRSRLYQPNQYQTRSAAWKVN